MKQEIWDFFENMNEIVYASDVKTHELVYMNRKARQQYNCQSLEEIKGKKCYELLQGSSRPCSICTNNRLKKGEFVEWRYFNPVVQKYFIIKDTLIEDDGREYRLELAVDSSIEEQQRKIIQGYIDNEAIINEGLRLSLSATEPDESIHILLEYIGRAFRCDRIYIFEEAEGRMFNNSYEWCGKGVSAEKDNLQNIPMEDAMIWIDRFEDNKNVIIKDLGDIKETDPVMYDYLKPQNIHSLIAAPLIFNNKLIGFYGVDNPPAKFMENISTMFMILGYFLASLLRRRDLQRRLECYSFYDQLTGFGNRHLMEEFIMKMQPENTIGVVYCDVTGLKKVNDSMGHDAGDKLLLKACACLKEAFEGYSHFRIGGDEFLVLCAGITEEEMEKRTEKLREIAKENEVVIAVGMVWSPHCRNGIDRLLMEADERMYEDKRAYYAKTRSGSCK
jgi:diguanylate cyclase (GGDEF)-like protein